MAVNQNPGINLGVINRLAGSVSVPSFPALSVTAAFLAKQAIRLAPEGDATKFLEVLTGVIPSPEPYQMLTVRIALVKTLPLCALYQAQFQQNTLIGNITIRPDISRGSGGLQPFDIQNAAIMGYGEMDFSGEDPAFVVNLRGSWQVNAALWSGVANIAIPA